LKIKNYKELDIWKRSVEIAIEIYNTSKIFPREELYGLTSQIRRASVSIPSNVAEGFHRYSKKEFINFLVISRGSIAEDQSHLFVALDLDYISKEQFNDIYSKSVDIFKQINSFIQYLRTCKDYNSKST